MKLMLVAYQIFVIGCVHGFEVNVAFNKTASTISGIYSNWNPSGAVDGDNLTLTSPSSCFLAATSPSDWTVDLGQEYQLYNIIVYLRTRFYHRTANSIIYLDNNSSRVCYTFPSTIYYNPTHLTCNGTARYVTIRNPGTGGISEDSLNICEVEIYACSSGSYGKTCNFECHCSYCDRWTGICSGDCEAGWKGIRCDIECESSFFGKNCTNSCAERHCAGHSSCDHVTGSCDNGCESGWGGQACRFKHQSPEATPDTTSAVVGLSTALVVVIIVAVVIISVLCWKMRRKTNGQGRSPNLTTIKENAGGSNQTSVTDVYTEVSSPDIDGNGHTVSESSVVETRFTYDTLQKSGDNLYTDLKPKKFYENI